MDKLRAKSNELDERSRELDELAARGPPVVEANDEATPAQAASLVDAAETKSKLAEAEAAIADLKHRNERLEEERARVRGDAEASAAQVAMLRDRLQDCERRLDDARTAAEAARGRQHAAELEVAKLQGIASTAPTTQADLEGRLQALQKREAELQAEQSRLNAMVLHHTPQRTTPLFDSLHSAAAATRDRSQSAHS